MMTRLAKVATPLALVNPVPIELPLSRNVTVSPLGIGWRCALVTVAVKVTDWPYDVGVPDVASAVVVASVVLVTSAQVTKKIAAQELPAVEVAGD